MCFTLELLRSLPNQEHWANRSSGFSHQNFAGVCTCTIMIDAKLLCCLPNTATHTREDNTGDTSVSNEISHPPTHLHASFAPSTCVVVIQFFLLTVSFLAWEEEEDGSLRWRQETGVPCYLHTPITPLLYEKHIHCHLHTTQPVYSHNATNQMPLLPASGTSQALFLCGKSSALCFHTPVLLQFGINKGLKTYHPKTLRQRGGPGCTQVDIVPS